MVPVGAGADGGAGGLGAGGALAPGAVGGLGAGGAPGFDLRVIRTVSFFRGTVEVLGSD